MKKATKAVRNKLNKKYLIIPSLLLVSLVVVMGGISFIGRSGSNEITTTLGTLSPPLERLVASLQVIPGPGIGAEQGLFDVILTIPAESISLSPGEELLFSVELTNFGTEQTEIDITYLIIQANGGDIVYIEHEKRVVENEVQFLKAIQLQDLPFGIYKAYIHLLYANATATASGEFNVEWK